MRRCSCAPSRPALAAAALLVLPLLAAAAARPLNEGAPAAPDPAGRRFLSSRGGDDADSSARDGRDLARLIAFLREIRATAEANRERRAAVNDGRRLASSDGGGGTGGPTGSLRGMRAAAERFHSLSATHRQ